MVSMAPETLNSMLLYWITDASDDGVSIKKWQACSVQLSSYEYTQEVAKHERSLRLARGDSFLTA